MRGLFLPSCLVHTQAARSQVVLRPYQEQCVNACLDALRSGHTRIGVSLPTGSGKTTVFISLLSRIPSPTTSSAVTRSLIIVNSVELARQSAAQVTRLFPHWTVEIEQGAKFRASGLADVTVATYQTLLQPGRLAKFDPAALKTVVIDEAHHAAAPSYRRLLSHFDSRIEGPSGPKPLAPQRNIPIVGFSATFSRHDGLALGSVFERIVYHRDFLELMREQWLCNVRFTCVRASLDLTSVTVNDRTGDFNLRSLAQVVNTDTINDLVVRTWLDRAGKRRSTVVFCVNVAHVVSLTQAFRDRGVDARYLHSKTPSTERHTLINDFKDGRFPVLINCAILTEGTDIPNIDCVIVARPTRSRNLFAQMIGRGMRLSLATGKEDCHIIDFVDTTTRTAGIISVPTLFGINPADVIIENETPESLEKITKEMLHTNPLDISAPESVTYTDYDDPFSWAVETSGAPHIARLSRNAWVGCGGDIYILDCLKKGHIRIEPTSSEDTDHSFRAFFTPAMLDKATATGLKMSPFMRSRHILFAKSLDEAVRGCDHYARVKACPGPMSAGLLRTAKWRRAPASDQQKQWVAKRWGLRSSASDQLSEDVSAEKIKTLTKGEAANIITRLKNGAQARYDKKIKLAARVTKLITKESARRRHEEVAVGPLS